MIGHESYVIISSGKAERFKGGREEAVLRPEEARRVGTYTIPPRTGAGGLGKVNGIDGIALTKLDVLDGIEELKVCVGYKIDGEEVDHLPASTVLQSRVEPVYKTVEGWSDSTQGARTWQDLPASAVKYVRYIEELIEAPVSLLSTSPERNDTVLVHDPFVD